MADLRGRDKCKGKEESNMDIYIIDRCLGRECVIVLLLQDDSFLPMGGEHEFPER
jgi:hypothetical protein